MSPSSSSRFDAGSEFSDDVSAASKAWGGRGGPGRAASSLPGSSGEMMAMKAGGNANAVATAPAAKTVLTTASMMKTVPGITGMFDLALGLFDLYCQYIMH